MLAGTVWLPGIVTIDRRLVAGVLAVDLALLGVRLFAVLDAGRGSRAPAGKVALAVLAVATVVPHVAFAYVTVRSYAVLETVFAEDEPQDVLPARGIFLASEPSLPQWVGPDGWRARARRAARPGRDAAARALAASCWPRPPSPLRRSGRGRRSS